MWRSSECPSDISDASYAADTQKDGVTIPHLFLGRVGPAIAATTLFSVLG